MKAPSPYVISGPALISFSGGRTSGFMLHEILAAHDGQLPPDVHVAFANTGKEREETLRFVHECGVRWGVPIHWLEWRVDKPGFEEVGYNSASRNGEPFAALIAKRSYLPNSVSRFCSIELKVRTAKKFAQQALGWKHWINCVGLRADEGHRCLKAYARNETNKEPFKAYLPLDKAGVTKRDVMAFWARQPFDLGLLGYQSNCDGCFLKAYGKLCETEAREPGRLKWWADQEAAVTGRTAKRSGARFVTEYSYASIMAAVRSQATLDFGGDEEDRDAECGLLCAA